MIESGHLAMLAANSNPDFLETQEHQIRALQNLGAPSWCILNWIEDPSRIPTFWETRILEVSGSIDEGDGEPTLTLWFSGVDDITFTVGDPTYTISGGFTSSPEFIPTGMGRLVYHQGEIQADAVEIELTTSGITGGPENWTFSYTRPTTDLQEGSVLLLTLYGTFLGTPSETNSLAASITINPA